MKTTPAYNLNVALRETGLKADTLRAWERRYGLPEPARSSGGHRLYSDRDIETIRWLQARLEEGLRIKQAVEMWKSFAAEGQDPLIVKPAAAPEINFDQPIYGQTTALEEMRGNWVTACQNFNESLAENIVNQAFAMYPAETVCHQVLLAGLAQIGDLWYLGKASVQQEHFASALVARRINTLIGASPPPNRTQTILIGCPPGENHTIAPLMLAFMLRQRGWRVVYLGANVPPQRFEETIQAVKPQLTILTAQHLGSAATLLDLADFLVQKEIRVAFGGLIFNRNPQLKSSIPGYYLGDQLQNAVNTISDILMSSPEAPKLPERTTEYQIALDSFKNKRPQIELSASENLMGTKIPFEHLSIANQFLSQNIIAALQIGNLDLLYSELSWIEKHIQNYQIDPVRLDRYLRAYRDALNKNMDNQGHILKEWFTWLNRNMKKS
jgi:MerR family transcriptional regulator, light-induced transcriptional regulator